MAVAELPRPGVEVIQVFQTVTPTVITPTLVPCIVGVCRQVVDVLTTTATGSRTLNSQALVALPAVLSALDAAGPPYLYTGLDTLTLVLSLNNGPSITITFAGNSLSPTQVVAQILLAFSSAGVTSFTAEVKPSGAGWRLRSIAANAFQSVEVMTGTSPAVLSTFGFAIGKLYTGLTGYDQHLLYVAEASYPDPNKNLAQLVVDTSTVHAYLFLGGNNGALFELLQTESFLENGIGTPASVTGSVDVTGLTFATGAVMTGSTDVTSGSLYGGGGTLNGTTLTINVDGAGATSLPLVGTGNAASSGALLAAIHAQWPTITATINGSNHLVLTDSTLGLTASSIAVTTTSASTALGISGTQTGTAGSLDGETLQLAFNGGPTLTVTFAPAANIANTLSQITAVVSAVATVTDPASGTHHLVLTTLMLGALASVQVVGGTGVGTIGLTVTTATGTSGVQAIDSGNGTALTPLLNFPGANFTTSPTAAQIVGASPVPSGGVPDGQTLTLDDGTEPQTLTFMGASTRTLVINQINALFGASAGGRTLATLNGSNDLVLTSTVLGESSKMQVVGGTAVSTLFLTAGSPVYGISFVPLPGDVVWVDGVQYATITQVAPGGNTSQLKIDHQVPISNNVGIAWFIEAKNLTSVSPPAGVTRPYPNLQIDSFGKLTIKPNILRDSHGNPLSPAGAQLYVAYHALRLDVTSKSKNPGLLRFSDTISLSNQLSPVDTDNPLALGLYFALLNAPNTQVVGLGVDETSGGSPFGTVNGFTRAATFLEAFEVYAVAPMTHDPGVSSVFQTHVDTMSAPENKGERVAIINPTVPTNRLDTLIASGVDGNTTPTSNTFDTGVQNLGALLVVQGLSGVGPYLTAQGIYLDIGDGNKYNIVNVVGSVVTVKVTGFLPGENDDGYYYAGGSFPAPPLTTPLIAQVFAVRIRGAALLLTDGTPDKDNIMLTVQQTAQGYADRRVWSTFPDRCAATLQGVEQILDGFYMNAAIAGMVGFQPPQQSFTNFPMTGFTRVLGSNDTFGERQLNVAAAGGNYIIVQDAAGVPLTSRMALTTDMTSVETRTDSITKIVDFCAKFLRQGLKNFIGRFNITQGFLDSLGHVIQGLLGFLTEAGILIGANLNNIVQDTSAPDTVLIDVTLDVPFPCNYIRLTLVI